MKIVAVTNCPAGIAHTYMIAEAFEKKAKSLGHVIHIETQGMSGKENILQDSDIKDADYVVLAVGKGLTDEDKARFAGKKLVNVSISSALKDVDDIFEHLEEHAQFYEGNANIHTSSNKRKSGNTIMGNLMAGMSACLPFVIAGGLLVAIANFMVQMGMPMLDFEHGGPSVSYVLNSLGGLGFQFMIPILGGYIAYNIADKPGLAPAFLVTYFANRSDLLGINSGTGFMGAIFFGLTIGYFVKWLKQIPMGKNMKSVMSLVGIPLITTLLFGVLAFYIIGPIIGGLMDVVINFLNDVPTTFKLPLAFLIGAMIAFDMGGPVNKMAWFFSFSLVSEGIYTWYGIVGIMVVVPPIAAGLATFIRPSLFSKDEKDMAIPAIIVGSTVATETAIPYALADPLPMISANTIAGGITGIVTVLFGIERLAPGLGIFEPMMGLMKPFASAYIVFAFGIALNTLLIIVFKTLHNKKKGKADD